MKLRTLLVLVVTAAGLLVVALVANREPRETSRAGDAGGLLVPGLEEQLNSITGITVTGAGGKTIATLNRDEQRWTVAERDNYPADMGRIRQNLRALAGAVKVEEKTSNPEFYERLGLEDPARPSARGVELTLKGTGEPLQVIIGDNRAGSEEFTYVRLATDARSWMVRGRFDPGRTTAEWLDRQLLDIPATRVQSVTITHPGTDILRVARAKPDDASFVVQNLPRGRRESYPGVADPLGGVLASLQLEDVSTRATLGQNPGKPTVTRFTTFDGLLIEASGWPTPDGIRFTFSASTDKSLAVKSGQEKAFPDSIRQAEAINARLGGWVYTLPSFSTELLTRRQADLLATTDQP